MSALGVRFGKALQLTNVLRDLPRDLRNGRCYLPQSQLAPLGLSPADLLEPPPWPAPRAPPWSGACAWPSTITSVPRNTCWPCHGPASACAWPLPGPLLMGLATLVKLARNPPVARPQPASSGLPRGGLYRTMALSTLCGWSNLALKWWIHRLRPSANRQPPRLPPVGATLVVARPLDIPTLDNCCLFPLPMVAPTQHLHPPALASVARGGNHKGCPYPDYPPALCTCRPSAGNIH